ncbi:MAG: efflux RND transporter permease subunit [Pseudomonadales bacterium]|nr:efflux RND transporter permease subunit [Pseudomonadales bacterium]
MGAFYTNPRLSALTVIFVLLIGALALSSLARQEDPTMTERWASVSTFLPGSSAERVESLVTEPIETKLREIPEIRTLDSHSRIGYSLIGIELYDHVGPGENDIVWSEVRDKLAEVHATLPGATAVPLLEMRAPLASTIVVALSREDGDAIEMSILSRLAAALEIRLANLPGTKETDVHGESEEEILISVDPYQLTAAGLTAAQMAAVVGRADTKASAGRLRSSLSDLIIEVDAELDTPERIAGIPLKETDSGRILRVGDLGEVRKYQVDPPRTLAFHGDTRTVMVTATMEPDGQIGVWIERALQEVAQFTSRLPAGIRAEVIYNQNDYTSERMDTLLLNLLSALVIVMVTLIWFMGVRSALTVGIALPLSGAMVLGFMNLMDVPLHQMSVTGLIISLGLLIDNAIVVVEDYKLNRSRGHEIAAAIDLSLRHLRIPLGASTLTTVFAFLTIAMAPGGIGDFTGTIGLSVVLAVSSSYFLAMTVVPAIASFLEQRWPARKDGGWWQNGYSNVVLLRTYRRSIRATLARPWLGVAAGCLLPLIGFLLAPTLTQQFFPPVDRNQFQLQLSMPSHASIWETRRVVELVDALVRAEPEVVDTHWTIGEGTPRVYYNVLTQNDGIASFAAAWVDTHSPGETRRLLPRLQKKLSRALPEARILALPFEQGPPFNAPIEMRLVGPDLNTLRVLSDEVRLILSSLEDVTYTQASLSASEPKLVFHPRENSLAAAGMRTGDLPGLLNDTLLGIHAGTVQEGSTELKVRVRIGNSARDDVDELETLPIPSATGGSVPLDQLGRWQLEPGASGIQRYQGERVSIVEGYLTPFVLPAGVMAEFRERLAAAPLSLPAGFRLEIGGEEEERTESMSNLLSVFILFAVAMAAVVILSLNSFRQACIIGLVALLSSGLALFGVRLFGWPFGFQALIGTLGMVGLAINGAIIVISALKAEPAASGNNLQAAEEVVVDATRHIISTTVTTIGGFLPLIIFGGTFWPPLATAIAGGVAGSAILALYTVPALYMRIQRSGENVQVTVAGAGSDPIPLPARKLAS